MQDSGDIFTRHTPRLVYLPDSRA